MSAPVDPKTLQLVRSSCVSIGRPDAVGGCLVLTRDKWCPCTASRGVVRMPRKVKK
jgi:hypothetical protein